ncbi:hypothetical protein AGMMS49942_03660 [Spirochaetia bacterium]|nr:hypothetical protein AGMMS49942_03660 [Spirochaetia bacterium]
MLNLVSLDQDVDRKAYTQADVRTLYRCSCGIMAIARVMFFHDGNHDETEKLNDIEEAQSLFDVIALLSHPITQFLSDSGVEKLFPEGGPLEPAEKMEAVQ